jgi:hypothetical protein
MTPMLVQEFPLLDELLATHATALGGDATAYRNHAYRVANLCFALRPGDEGQLEKTAIAAAFHDLGIWTDHTFDYLKPSERLALARLAQLGHTEWSLEISEMIMQHHKLRRYRAHDEWLVEPFRRADLIDVSQGLVRFGLPREFIRDLYERFPGAGFHKRLVHFGLERLRTNPLSPLPMIRI